MLDPLTLLQQTQKVFIKLLAHDKPIYSEVTESIIANNITTLYVNYENIRFQVDVLDDENFMLIYLNGKPAWKVPKDTPIEYVIIRILYFYCNEFMNVYPETKFEYI